MKIIVREQKKKVVNKARNFSDDQPIESNICSLRRTQSFVATKDDDRRNEFSISFDQFQSKIIPRAKLMGKSRIYM